MENIDSQMTLLSSLKNGEYGIITKVKGYGAFRKRISEMGFVTGSKVTVIKKAPLQDPVEYEVMGYRVSLRKREADLIEVATEKEAENMQKMPFGGTFEETVKRIATEKGKVINVALVGNPNCGKTSMFNHTTGQHEHVGNYSGVTVDLKTSSVTRGEYKINVTDLPGTYSISEYSPEERYVRKHLTTEMPDIVINVVDASNLERNLFLTTQLIDMDIKVVMALNMYDELEKKGDKFDYKTLGKMIGIPIVPTVASKGKGLDDLLDKVIELYEDKSEEYRHIHINYGHSLNEAISCIKKEISKNHAFTDMFHSRYVAIKLLENEQTFVADLKRVSECDDILNVANEQIKKIEDEFDEKSSAVLTDAKYAFVRGALQETYQKQEDEAKNILNYAADVILTHKWFGFPFFLFFMWLMFQLTFTVGGVPMEWIDAGVGALSDFVRSSMDDGPLRSLLVDGIIGGVGGVIIFLPNILILFLCISLMEDTGYMARAAFIMDRLMHAIGLHGKSFIPLLMGFGCNVPAIMATRTLDNRKDRIITIMILPFMSCSARLPVFVLLISAFFTDNQGLVLLSVYAVGVLVAILTAVLFRRLFFKEDEVPFVMELPPYRMPTMRNTLRHMWDKSVQYLSKMGTVILTASILIWALGYFPQDVDYSKDYEAELQKVENNSSLTDELREELTAQIKVEQESEHTEKSYIGQLGHAIEPVIEPLGYDWKIGVSIITGLAAKEIVVGSMGVLYQSDLEADENSANLQEKLKTQKFTSGDKVGQLVFTPVVAYSFMIFVLLYFPCFAALAAIRREAGTKWAALSAVYTTGVAWIVAFVVTQVGSLL